MTLLVMEAHQILGELLLRTVWFSLFMCWETNSSLQFPRPKFVCNTPYGYSDKRSFSLKLYFLYSGNETKKPASFLGEGASLVDLDSLMSVKPKPKQPSLKTMPMTTQNAQGKEG